jgi:hypothetical protein
MNLFKQILLCGIVLIYANHANSQDVDIRQIRIAGGNINFLINSYNKYENGITYPINTRLSITYRVDGSSGWELYAWTDQTEFISDTGEVLPLEALEIDFPLFTSTDDGSLNTDFKLFEETNKELLASGTGGDPNQVDIELVVTYSIGKSPDEDYKLMNKVEGFYYLNIHFELVKVE